MKEEILHNLNNPSQLEKLYRSNKLIFRKEFNNLYNSIKENVTAQFWHERLNFETEEISWGTKRELIFVIVAGIIAGIIAKLPEIIRIDEEYFYTRNISFIVFPFLTAYFAWKQKIKPKIFIIAFVAIILSVIYINFLPNNSKSDTLILACIHLPLFLWAVLCFVYTGNNLKSYSQRLDFLKYNGDLVVMTTIILIAGALLAVITVGLFNVIGAKIEDFYLQHIAVFGLAASPMVATYLIQSNPQLVNKVSPVIAKVFTPLVLVTLIIYLFAIIYAGKNPYIDREFLLMFNLLLIGVMAIILFSITATAKSANKTGTVLLLFLSLVTILINAIALSAILFRVSEGGITPNRLAVLGSNLLILTNLLLVTYQLLKTVRNKTQLESVETSIVSFIPVYVVWIMLVTFLFPVIFQFQ